MMVVTTPTRVQDSTHTGKGEAMATLGTAIKERENGARRSNIEMRNSSVHLSRVDLERYRRDGGRERLQRRMAFCF